jgi:uncharacterized protein YbjT (DUF2867 family)
VLPTVRIERTDVHDAAAHEREFAGCAVVINLVGILNERRPGNRDREFRRAHTKLPIKVVQACKSAGVRRYLHMSELKADAQYGPSHHLRSKGAAEDYLRRECAAGQPEFVIFQPSVVFGPQDEFINKLAAILKIMPGFLPLACVDAEFAPGHVGDVAAAFVRCRDRRDVAGRTFELYGPETITLGDIVRLTASTLGLRPWVIPPSRAVARIQAAVADYVPGKPFSTDNFHSASIDSVGERDGLAEVGISRTPLRGTVGTYLRK